MSARPKLPAAEQGALQRNRRASRGRRVGKYGKTREARVDKPTVWLKMKLTSNGIEQETFGETCPFTVEEILGEDDYDIL